MSARFEMLFECRECFKESGARHGYVEAHESFALLSEHGAVVEGYACFVKQTVDQFLLGVAQGAAVEPYEE